MKNELHQVQTQAWHDALMIQALKSAKSNFVIMQSWLDKSLVKNEDYRTQLPTLQDHLLVIQANLDHLQVEKVELEVEYQKVETN